MAHQHHRRFSLRFPPRVITPITGILALVIGSTGIMLFFHLGEGLVKGVHEWLGMLLVLAMLIHFLSNWRAFGRHLRHPGARWGVAAVSLATLLFIGGSLGQPAGGPRLVVDAVVNAPVSTLAGLFEIDEQKLLEGLEGAGLRAEDGSRSLSDMTRLADMDRHEAFDTLTRTVTRLKRPDTGG